MVSPFIASFQPCTLLPASTYRYNSPMATTKPRLYGVIDTAPDEFRLKAFVSARKADYPIYWNDENWDDGLVSDDTDNRKSSDFFATKNSLIRLPACVRIMRGPDDFTDISNVYSDFQTQAYEAIDQFGGTLLTDGRKLFVNYLGGNDDRLYNLDESGEQWARPVLAATPFVDDDTEPEEQIGGRILYILLCGESRAYEEALGDGGSLGIAAQDAAKWLEYEARSEEVFLHIVRRKILFPTDAEDSAHGVFTAIESMLAPHCRYERIEALALPDGYISGIISSFFGV